MPLTPDNLDKVMTELVAVSRSAMSKREEAVNLARIWGRDDGEVPGLIVRATQEPGAEFRALTPVGPATPATSVAPRRLTFAAKAGAAEPACGCRQREWTAAAH